MGKKTNKKNLPQTEFEPVHAVLHSLGDTELNYQTIWTVAYLWLLYFDKDIFAYNSILKVKLKILERVNLFFALSAGF